MPVCMYEANIEALNFIKNTVEQHKIDCDLSEQDAYIYATFEKYAKKIEKEAEAYEKIGIMIMLYLTSGLFKLIVSLQNHMINFR